MPVLRIYLHTLWCECVISILCPTSGLISIVTWFFSVSYNSNSIGCLEWWDMKTVVCHIFKPLSTLPPDILLKEYILTNLFIYHGLGRVDKSHCFITSSSFKTGDEQINILLAGWVECGWNKNQLVVGGLNFQLLTELSAYFDYLHSNCTMQNIPVMFVVYVNIW